MRLARDPQLGAWARCVQLFVCLMFACAPAAGAQTPVTGAITGTVQSADGAGIPGAVITVVELRRATSSDQNGSFTLAGLPAGRYTVIVNIGELESRQADVDVVLGQAVRLARVLPRDFSVVMAVTVSGASRSPELLAEAPAPVTRVSAAQVALRGGSGQIPALLQFAPGVDYAQSGVYNMEFNSRGFNTALSRRVQVLIDGRDAAAPESKNQEWINLGFLTPDIEAIELVRGPNAALYGANSMNGVLMIETKTPRATPGGRARITTGDLGTFMADLRWAGEVAPDWWMKALANHTRSGSFARSRVHSSALSSPLCSWLLSTRTGTFP